MTEIIHSAAYRLENGFLLALVAFTGKLSPDHNLYTEGDFLIVSGNREETWFEGPGLLVSVRVGEKGLVIDRKVLQNFEEVFSMRDSIMGQALQRHSAVQLMPAVIEDDGFLCGEKNALYLGQIFLTQYEFNYTAKIAVTTNKRGMVLFSETTQGRMGHAVVPTTKMLASITQASLVDKHQFELLS